jgi:hypothetical protein
MTGTSQGRRPRKAPAASASSLEARMAEMEDRVERMESRRQSMQNARTWFEQIVPPEASRHFKTAMKEQLLGVRTLVDHWISRIERERRASERETISID